eukprot:TRINITY_DN5708_c0_g1_i2.p2 TRINITY_DN5708_c0_g1~~TRINITY_DN5708_c0_g1_i2.p2  ORF type:complete len:159 (+),score=23.95 TRINITY_DN5708_c0_g1_i2:86-562(+)
MDRNNVLQKLSVDEPTGKRRRTSVLQPNATPLVGKSTDLQKEVARAVENLKATQPAKPSVAPRPRYNPFAPDPSSDGEQPTSPQAASGNDASDVDDFGRKGRRRSSSREDDDWDSRMDRLLDRYETERGARDTLRARYGDLTPSPESSPERGAHNSAT